MLIIMGLIASSIFIGVKHKKTFFVFTIFFVLVSMQDIIRLFSSGNIGWVLKIALIYLCVALVILIKKGELE